MFIVFEGLDGSGKSTQAAKLTEYLSEQKQKLLFSHTGVHLTKEPTSGLIGELIRGQLTHNWKSSSECLQLLFAADRAHHLEKEITPILERGGIVICDRYFFSSFAYGSLDISKDWLFKINKNFLLPDITFLLKVPPKICVERIKKARYAATLFEKEEILEKVWRNYRELTKKFKNIYIVNGEQSVEKVFANIIKIIDKKTKIPNSCQKNLKMLK